MFKMLGLRCNGELPLNRAVGSEPSTYINACMYTQVLKYLVYT